MEQYVNGDGSGGGDDEHHGELGRVHQSRGHADSDGGDTAVDRCDTGDGEYRGGTDAAIHSDGDVQQWNNGSVDDGSGVDIVEHRGSDDQGTVTGTATEWRQGRRASWRRQEA